MRENLLKCNRNQLNTFVYQKKRIFLELCTFINKNTVQKSAWRSLIEHFLFIEFER